LDFCNLTPKFELGNNFAKGYSFTCQFFFLKIRTTIAFLLIATMAITAQNDVLRVRNYGIEDGLSQRNIFKVQQNGTGFLWVSTNNGLDRFDGHSFVQWYGADENNYLPAGTNFDLVSGLNNDLWLSRGDLVLKISSSKIGADTVLTTSADHSEHFGNLAVDGLGRIWTTRTSNADSTIWLQWIDKEGSPFDIADLPYGQENKPITRASGFVYVGAFENEIWVYDLDGKLVKHFEFPATNNDKRYSRVVQLQTGPKGNVWALLDHGQLYYLPPNGDVFVRHPISKEADDHFHTSAVLVSANGDIWMSGLVSAHNDNDVDSPCSSVQPGAALLHFNVATNYTADLSYFLKQALPYAEPPRQIFQDNSGVIWVATPFGLIHIVENDLFVRYMSEGNDCCKDGVCSMRGITEDDQGNIYFSYYNSIHTLNPRNGSLTPLFSKQLINPFSILFDQGYIWTGNGIRINVRTAETDTVVQGLTCPEGVVMKDSDGEFWFGCGQKLVRWTPSTQQQVAYRDSLLEKSGYNNITCLVKGQAASTFWLATRESGLFKIDKRKGIVAHFDTSSDPALPNNRVLAVEETNDFLWIGTAAGLCRISTSNNESVVYKTKNGLANNFINGLLTEGDSAVWVSTDNGLSRLDIQTGTCSNFFKSDGLTKNEFNRMSFFKAHDGRMYFGGIEGINAFYPSARYGDRQNKMKTPLMLSSFSKFNGHTDITSLGGLAPDQPIVLSPQDKTFTFQYSMADFTEPDNQLYSHMLEGFDKSWSVPSPLNSVRYVNTPAGKYKLRMRASRGGTDWVKSELNVPIIVQQAFYKTLWFKLLALGLAIIGLYGFMQYRFYLVKKHEQELESQVQERTRELETEKAKSDELLLNILPAETAEELKMFGTTKARRFDDVTVMFTDFKGFSFIARNMEPEALVAEIDHCFRAFDKIIEEFDLEKIKTIGDAYLCSGRLKDSDKRAAAVRTVQAALKIQEFLAGLAAEREGQHRPCFEARIGIHSGPVVGGIVGFKKFAYDIWGDTVNISERLQSNGMVGKVNVSKSTFELIKDDFNCAHRGKILAKHQGEIDMYFVDA